MMERRANPSSRKNELSATNRIEQINRELTKKLLEEAERDPQSAYRGRFVGIASGQVVVVSKDWEEVSDRLRQLQPNSANRTFIHVGDPASWPLGKYVGIASGKVVAVSEDLDEIVRKLDQAESDRSNTFLVEPGRDYSKVVEIWALT